MSKSNKLFLIVLGVICLSYLLSCASAEKLTHKAIAKDAHKVQDITRSLWPCIVTDSTVITKYDTLYDFIEVQCPDTIAYRVDSFETSTAVRVPYRVPVYVKVQTPRIRETVTHTIRIKDVADVEICQDEKAAMSKRLRRAEGWTTGLGIAALLGWILFILSLLIKRR